MIRMMMWDHTTGDRRFQQMMSDFIKTHYNKDVSTEDFQRAVEKYMTPSMDLNGNQRLDWFFNEYVYGTEIPRYNFEYTLGSDGGKPFFSGKVTQSGVSDGFKMMVPIYADFGQGWFRLGSANITGNRSVEIKNVPLPQQPKRMAICALDDVLALGMDSKKQ
jgi:aminopeptidase N